jgi:hypothetical protein
VIDEAKFKRVMIEALEEYARRAEAAAKPEPEPEDEWISYTEAGAIAHVQNRTVGDWVREGKLERTAPELGRPRVRKSQLLALLSSNRTPGGQVVPIGQKADIALKRLKR